MYLFREEQLRPKIKHIKCQFYLVMTRLRTAAAAALTFNYALMSVYYL